MNWEEYASSEEEAEENHRKSAGWYSNKACPK